MSTGTEEEEEEAGEVLAHLLLSHDQIARSEKAVAREGIVSAPEAAQPTA